ncbi:MAG: ABC transporter substrate-binding protein [Alphaproteobacteria bacterium]|nr:ABC transporter substrate-binding protein [Alphaproteobacteria bacterium]
MKFFTIGGAVVGALIATGVAVAQPADTLRIGSPVVCPQRGLPAGGSASPCVYTHWPSYDTLVQINEKGEVVPLIATEWKVQEDKTKWQVKIRSGVQFHNGDPLTAEMVRLWFEYLGTQEAVSKYVTAQNFQRQGQIVDTKVIAPDTIELTTRVVNSLLPRLLSVYWLPNSKAFKENPDSFNNQGNGTGPYRLVAFDPNEVRYEAAPNAWRKAPVPKMRLINVPEVGTRVAGILSGELDVGIGLSIDRIDEVKRAGHQVHIIDRPDINSLRFNWYDRDTPFKDKRVRQAAKYALDRGSIQRDLMKNISAFTGQCATETNFGYNPDVKPYAFDQAKARQLLTEAGFPNGIGPFKIDVIPGNFPADSEIYQKVAQDLNAVGMKAELQIITFADWLRKWTPPPTEKSMLFPDMFQNGCMNFTAHPMDAMINLSCRKPQKSHCVEEEMRLIEAIEAEFDPDKQRPIVRELLRVNADNSAFLDLPVISDITALNKRVRGFANAMQRYSFTAITFAN